MLQRQLRATANLQALLAAKDCELIDCRARLERYERPRTTTCCDPDVDEDAEATTPVQEHHFSKYITISAFISQLEKVAFNDALPLKAARRDAVAKLKSFRGSNLSCRQI